jgi:uncharacterized repeat protein (TIGR01451 family)
MTTHSGQLRRAMLALLTLSSFSAFQNAYAVGTPADTEVTNRATVVYAVGGVTQDAIESSPDGNSTPGTGAGADTAFVVDNRIDLTVEEVSDAAEVVSPGQNNVAAVFTITNTGNGTQGYQLAASNDVGTTLFGNADNLQMNNLRTFVDSNGNGVYDHGVDAATHVDALTTDADGETITVFVVSDVPLTASNTSFANVTLTVRVAVPGTNGGTLVVESTGTDDPTQVDVVFADAGRDATEVASDQYDVNSASLEVTKTATVISDLFNGTTNPKAIPGATVEYAITVNNNGSLSAQTVRFSDPVPANTTFAASAYGGANQDIQIVNGATTTVCSASSTDADGCSVSGGQLVVDGNARPTIAAGQTATVRFRVTIN